MAVPSTITDLSVTATSNSPAGTDVPNINTGPDDFLRALSSIIRREQAQFTAVASAATVDLGAIATGNYGHITGTVTITSFGTVAAGIERTVVFDGVLTLTHNATSLILRTGANRTTAAGDVAVFVSEGAGNWREKAYHKVETAYQPLDDQLTTLAGITAQQAADLASVSTFIGTLLNDADAATARETLGVYKDIQPIGASVAANALTLTLNPTVLGFRSATLASGTTNTRTVSSAISVVVPDTATLGTVSGAATRLVILAIDNAGTVELAVVNDATGNTLDETTLISTTAITTGADSASVIYSTTARTNVPFRVVGFVDITEATAGTWATAPSLIQGIGGQVFVSTGSKSLAASGYQKLPGGLILQWGITASVANGEGRTATFPITFPNAAFVGFVIGTIGGGSAEPNHVVTALSTTTLTFTNYSTATQPFYYFSIGY